MLSNIVAPLSTLFQSRLWGLFYFVHVAKVMVTLMTISTTSIQVTWDQLCTSEITGYRVYYRQSGKCEMDSTEQYSTVSCSENSVTIDNLLTNVEYQFQVVAIAGDTVVGERSNVSVSRTISPPATTETLCKSRFNVLTLEF